MSKKGKVIRPNRCPTIVGTAAVVGKKEFDGPLGSCFDYHDEKGTFGRETWEQAEGEMQHMALNLALTKAGWQNDAPDALLAGDLINQCTCSNYGLLDTEAPYFGLYGACSTSAEALILGTVLYQIPNYDKIALVTSSHNCTAERQFRYPVEYGGLRAPTGQFTVTAAAAFLLGEGEGCYITEALPGISRDLGITDINNMGAAMAPAAIDTLTRYFEETGSRPSDFDGIFTGDLGAEGHGIVIEQMGTRGFDMTKNYDDCGLLIYDRKVQDTHAGGSGCGCGGSVLACHLIPKLKQGELHDILYIATGALMSPMTVFQGESIPGIAHLVRLTAERML